MTYKQLKIIIHIISDLNRFIDLSEIQLKRTRFSWMSLSKIK